MNIKMWIVIIILMCIGFGISEMYKEKWRPQYHFTPPDHWMNDPNGLSFYKGYFHMFFQYNCDGIVIGNQSWGHAISTDMVYWKYTGVAIPRFGKNYIFSGCAVVFNETLNAIYTVYHEEEQGIIEDEYLSRSMDGFSFTSYVKNPILTHNSSQLQDPKVILYNNEFFVMAIAIPDERIIQFYKSKDLVTWKYLSQFEKKGSVEYHWEMPVLNRIHRKGEEKGEEDSFILMVNVGYYTQYFFGTFDGVTFTPFEKNPEIRLVDYGPDFFETQTFYKTKELNNRNILIANIVNYHYALSLPTTIWRNTQSLPRKLTFRELNIGTNKSSSHLFQEPIEELKGLRLGDKKEEYRNLTIFPNDEMTFSLDFAKTMEIEFEGIEITTENDNMKSCRLEVFVHTFKNEEQKTIIGYDHSNQSVYLDRTHSGVMNFSQYYEQNTVFWTPKIRFFGGKLVDMRIFVDWSSIEVFVNSGEYTMTAVIFPEYESEEIFVRNSGCESEIRVGKLNFYGLDSIH